MGLGRPPPTFACVRRDQVSIFLCQGAQGAPGTWISIFVQNVDALYEDYQRRGADIRQAPTNFPWGVREMNVQDLDGHRLRLGSDATGPADEVHLTDELKISCLDARARSITLRDFNGHAGRTRGRPVSRHIW